MAGLTAQSGNPFTATVLGATADASGSGTVGSLRADATGAPVQREGAYFNTLAFATPPATRYGNAARNTIPGPAFVALSASFGRQFPLGDTVRRGLEARVSAENLLNHVEHRRAWERW